VKLYGDDLDELRRLSGEAAAVMQSVGGLVDVQVERQVLVPQLLIRVNREALVRYGLPAAKVAQDLEVFFNGLVAGQVIDGQQSFDILLRTTDAGRSNIEQIRQTLIDAPDGRLVPLHHIADIEYTAAVNAISHENMQRRMTVSANVQDRDLGSTVEELRQRLGAEVELPEGYFFEFAGQFESQQAASRMIAMLSLFSLAGIFLVLYSHFRSIAIALQIMLNVPLALVGSVVAVWLTGGVFSVATLVGFITLTGIASRNGIMMISHYLHLVEHEGEQFGRDMIIRGSLERLVPVLMTALVAALALIPLTLDPQASGKEILYPVATVILGGLVSSTLLDMIVTPTVFYLFGEKAVRNYLNRQSNRIEPDNHVLEP
jgi:Cu/Ag efflux pump CusA